MTSVEELRTAATKLRERAAQAERGLVAALREGTRDLFGNAAPDPAAMHPPVGVALAAWLELEADVIAAREADFEGGEWAVDLGGDCALAVARAINGGAR